MKQLRDHLNLPTRQNGSSQCSNEEKTKEFPDDLTEELVNNLFARFAQDYQGRWTSSFPNEDLLASAVRDWNRELSKIPPGNVKRAIGKLREKYPSWPPTIGQFIQLCKPTAEELGVPSVESAWVIVCNPTGDDLEDRWQHPVVFEAAKHVDVYNLQKYPMDKALKFWRPVYEKFVNRLAAGEEFKFPDTKQIEHDGKREASRETALFWLRKAREILGVDEPSASA